MTSSEVDACAEAYEVAEAAYLGAVAQQRSTADLATLATTTWSEAKQWEAVAYEHFFAVRDRGVPDPEGVVRAEIVAETAEALTGLWKDLAAAHRVD